MSKFSAEFLARAEEVPADLWPSQDEDPFISRSFLHTLEIHGAASPRLGWQPAHLVLRDEHQVPSALMPLYARNNSFGDFVRDWSWAGAFEQRGLAYFPKLVTGVPYTPVPGRRLWAENDDARRALIEATLDYAVGINASSWHVAFASHEDAVLLAEAGLMPQANVQFHWFNRGYRNFDDYLATFAAEKRRKVRAERRKVAEAGIEVRTLGGREVTTGQWSRVHALYAATFRRYGNFPALTAACLAALGESLGDRMQVVAAFRADEIVAVALCFVGRDVLYGRYWGAAEDVSGLHFELCYYQGIDYCIRHGLARFEPGAGGEHKLARGFEPVKLATWHWIANPEMRELLRRHLARVDDASTEYQAEAASHLPFKSEL